MSIPVHPSPPAITRTMMHRVGCYAFDAPEALRRLANLIEREGLPAWHLHIHLEHDTYGCRAYATFPGPAELPDHFPLRDVTP